MLSGGELAERLRARFSQTGISYRFPTTHISIVDPAFVGDDNVDESTLAERLDLSIAALREVTTRLFIRFDLRRPTDPPSERPDRGHTWSRWLWSREDPRGSQAKEPLASLDPPRFVHFYGYKGGQARSTVLGFLGKALARDGWRVLTVDVDAEAPTLDVLFDVRAPDPSGTLVGLRAGLELAPFRAFTPPQGDGCLDVVAFRPRDESFDFDAAALAMEMAIAPPFSERLIESIARLEESYDVIFVDHRTGLAASVPPWVERLPGPVVAFSRMDGQWEGAATFVETLWRLDPRRPGLLVTFKSDDGDVLSYMKRAVPQANRLLQRLADVVNTARPNEAEPVIPEDLSDHWLIWSHDSAFGAGRLPNWEQVSGATRGAIDNLKRLLELRAPKDRTRHPPRLHPSGARDEGDLIITQALRELDTDNAAKWFILGRKGTGKTRLMKELARRGRGEPLLVAEGSEEGVGLQATHSALRVAWERSAANAEVFWWRLIRAALTVGNTEEHLVDALEKDHSTRPLEDVIKLVTERPERRVFLIDGLETAFPLADTYAAIDALFRVWSTLDVDSRLSGKVRLRIFIRTDLARRGYENLEQTLYDRVLELVWDTQSILNFALSRIASMPWYEEHFRQAVDDIRERSALIREGQLDPSECDRYLLQIFPERVRQQNMLTTTFLRTWFSDDPSGQIGYFPRIYSRFLEAITEGHGVSDAIEDGRVHHRLMLNAHEVATEDFLQQVKIELDNLVDLQTPQVDRLLSAFRGRVTPFSLAHEVRELHEVTGLEAAAIRQALEQMKQLGVFEDRPGYSGDWRAGRLFKTSLGMLYKRKRRSD